MPAPLNKAIEKPPKKPQKLREKIARLSMNEQLSTVESQRRSRRDALPEPRRGRSPSPLSRGADARAMLAAVWPGFIGNIASSIGGNRSRSGSMRAIIGGNIAASLAVSMVWSPLAQAETAPTAAREHRRLTPYEAVYKTSTSGLSIRLRRSLSMESNGVCRLTSEGRLLVAGISEVSVFSVAGAQVRPKSYIYQLSGPVSRRREVHFDEGSDVIRSLYKKEWYALPKTHDTLDRMSQQEQLRLLLLNDPTPRHDIRFRVADGRRVKEYRLHYRGDARVETPMGWVDTLRFARKHDNPKRRSEVWIAPEWDYLIVRTLHVDDGKTTVADLVSARIEGHAVSGNSI